MNSAFAEADAAKPLLSVRGICKSFGGVEVLRNVDLELAAGEVHALLGENGAGKSTFAKILAGVLRPSQGSIHLHGEGIEVSSPLEAQRLGIALIHQEPISFPDLSIAENLILGRLNGGPLCRVRWSAMERDARHLMGLLGVELDVTRPMRGLSIADQQMVEIARALAGNSRLIIMDEPTAALTPAEVDTFFAIVRRLKDEGRTIIFISHRLEEVRAICERVTVFRDGDKVTTAPIAALDDAEIIRLMIGRSIKEYLHRGVAAIGEVALAVRALSLPGHFENVSFELRRGEIVGLGGLVGAGRTDLARALFGLAPAASGSIWIGGKQAAIADPIEAVRLGIAFVPEDRAIAGIFRSLSIASNITAAIPQRIAPHGAIRWTLERSLAQDAVSKLGIRLHALDQPIEELSGGNQQKAILARWLLTNPMVLILDEPTRGVDVGVKAQFYHLIGELAAAGCAILLISSELPELLALSDRILVMAEGRLTASFSRSEATQETIMQAAVPRSVRHRTAMQERTGMEAHGRFH